MTVVIRKAPEAAAGPARQTAGTRQLATVKERPVPKIAIT